MSTSICVVGSIHMDLVVRAERFARAGETLLGGPFAIHPGGKGANQAVAASRMGAQVSLVGSTLFIQQKQMAWGWGFQRAG